MRIACLGPKHTYSEEALTSRFPDADLCLVLGDVWDVIAHIADCDRVIVPVYNNAGKRDSPPFPKVYDTLVKAPAFVVEVLKHPIRWCAMFHSSLEHATTLYSHPQGFNQCARWLAPYHWHRRPMPSTTAAVQAAHSDHNSVALGSRRAAEAYGFPFRLTDIEDRMDNATWFFLLAQQLHATHSHSCHTLVVTKASKKEKPAIPLRDRWVSEQWEFLEIQNPCTSHMVQRMMEFLERERGFAKIVGCYPDYDRQGLVPLA